MAQIAYLTTWTIMCSKCPIEALQRQFCWFIKRCFLLAEIIKRWSSSYSDWNYQKARQQQDWLVLPKHPLATHLLLPPPQRSRVPLPKSPLAQRHQKIIKTSPQHFRYLPLPKSPPSLRNLSSSIPAHTFIEYVTIHATKSGSFLCRNLLPTIPLVNNTNVLIR